MKFGKKLAMSSKKINSEPVHNKKCLKAEKKSMQQKVFNVNENYYPKVFSDDSDYQIRF